MKNLPIVNMYNMDCHRRSKDYYISKDKRIIYCIKTGEIAFIGEPFTRKEIDKYIHIDLLKRKKK